MKKLFNTFFCFFILCAFFSLNAFAKNTVCEIYIEVTLQQDGSAYIVQHWEGDFDEGTENYIPINTADVNITDFAVYDEQGAYEFTQNWDVDKSFEQKARKCGIVNTYDGIELCFGISEYGEKRYAIEYTVEDFIKAYTDYDGTNFMFVNPGMNTFPTDCSVVITTYDDTWLNEENAAIWAFGYEGMIEFSEDGRVFTYTTSPLTDDECVIVMLRLEKGVVYPQTYVDGSFSEVQERAFEGSDYGESFFDKMVRYIVLIAIAVIAFLTIAFVISRIKRSMALKKFYKNVNYYRSEPNNKKLSLCYYLTNQFSIQSNENLIIGAELLSMVNNGNLETVKEQDVGAFGKVKEKVSLKLKQQPQEAVAQKLYSILEESCGQDGILQQKELEKYTYKHPEKLKEFVKLAKDSGEREFIALGGFTKYAGDDLGCLTEQGKAQLSETMGFKKYLEDFSLISEREITEIGVWKSFLVYAFIFGIADKVKDQIKNLYPEASAQYNEIDTNLVLCHSYYSTMHRSYTKATQAQRSAGKGGAASLRGGGGFSGGGSGGGSR